MKKSTLTLALITAGLVSSPSFAQSNEENWVGVYGLYYGTDKSKPIPTAHLDDGFGLGVEAGFRFDQNWAGRISASHLDISGSTNGVSDDGLMLGVDLMYFFNDFYVFGGVYDQDIGEGYEMLGYGLGRHWTLSENLSFVSEFAAYRDIDESLYDYGLKLGVSYTYGGSSGSSAPTPAPATATVSSDSDNDGVSNANDRCPNTPAGAKVDSYGCELDSDNDGVVNSKDACMNTPAGDEVNANGCTVLTEKDVSIEIRILFAHNSAVIEDPDSSEILDLVEFLKRYGQTDALIEGHASAPGTAAYNKDLSLRRANALKDLLMNRYDIRSSRLDTVGYGEERLLDKSNTAAAHRINRRIEVKISETVEVPK
ncbi:OmpA family protein [Alteromonas gilva]|uniref:OmpA family protein n=1 Tax=Alteromonas gilva TaxID=2987522 RepID=A0ABT5KYK4_9ALTE|nr:OmpA family protein [Alteromonas gilva]MDC8829855.1 OmpA family protein [Alteromonas gilva]